MRVAARAAVLAACLILPSIAAADPSDEGAGWYVGFGLGRTTASQAPGGLEISNYPAMSIPYGDPALRVSTPTNLSSTSSDVEAGVWISRYVGLQVGYLDLGTYSNALYARDPHDNICFACTSRLDHTTDFSETAILKVRGAVLAATGRVPLPDEFELLGKLGWLDGKYPYSDSVTGLQHLRYSASYLGGYHAWVLGVGLGWRFASHWGIGLWWDEYRNTNQHYVGYSYASGVKLFDVKGYSLAVQYHF